MNKLWFSLTGLVLALTNPWPAYAFDYSTKGTRRRRARTPSPVVARAIGQSYQLQA